jgi:CRISPR-associated protein Csb1
LIDIALEPVAGSRFQPTGFPDIGAAVFKRPVRDGGQLVWTDALLLESAQSMANRLEAVGWDGAEEQPVPTLAGLPYVRVVADEDGRYLTSSRTEAHRLASAFIKDSHLDGRSVKEVFRERLGLRDDTPLAPRDIARAVFALDPLSLVHGVFFADREWPGQPKIQRAVTGFIEALDVQPAMSGGVKRDDVRHSIGDAEAGGAKEGYGFVPFHRTEYTAAAITVSFAIDLGQFAAYGLGDAVTELLASIARWEIRAFIERGLRLRTACDLAPLDGVIADRDGVVLPPEADLASEVGRLSGECRDLLGDGRPLEVRWTGGGKSSKRAARSPEGEPGES